jgi:hypothetical protein
MPLHNAHCSHLLNAILYQAVQLFVVEINHDTSDRYADCEHDCNGAPTGRIFDFGWYGHCCFVNTDDKLLCGTIVDALGGDLVMSTRPTFAER